MPNQFIRNILFLHLLLAIVFLHTRPQIAQASPTSRPTTSSSPSSKPTSLAPTSLLPPQGLLCNAVIETKIFAKLPKQPAPNSIPLGNQTPQLHIRATYNLVVVASTSTGYVVEGQTTAYEHLQMLGRPPNDSIKGLLSIYAGATWRVHLNTQNQITSIHYGQLQERVNKHQKVTERALHLLFLPWPNKVQQKQRHWTFQRTQKKEKNASCSEQEKLSCTLQSQKGSTITLQGVLQKKSACSDQKYATTSQSILQGQVQLSLGNLQQDSSWKGQQSSTMISHSKGFLPFHHRRPMHIRVLTKCTF